jgi:hypothetical protein
MTNFASPCCRGPVALGLLLGELAALPMWLGGLGILRAQDIREIVFGIEEALSLSSS